MIELYGKNPPQKRWREYARSPRRSGVLFVVVASLIALAFLLRGPGGQQLALASEPQLPINAAFFYAWYPSHWTEEGVFPYTKYSPSLGYYDSMEPDTIRQQLELAERAHLDAFISSWWGQAEVTDTATQEILRVTEESGSRIRWSTYYEGEGYSDPAPDQIASDLSYMAAELFNSPAYLRVNDKPVLFVYGQGHDGCSMVDRWLQAENLAGIDLYLNLKVFEGYADCPSQPDSWHQYSPTSAFEYQAPYSITISPGFSRYGQPTALVRDLTQFTTSVQWMSLATVDWKLITTWNEWLEGTAIEPAGEYGESYVEILCNNLSGTEPCDVNSPTPTASASPGSTATPVSTPASATPTGTATATATPTPQAPAPTPTATPTPEVTASYVPTNAPATGGPSPGLPPPAAPTVTPPRHGKRALLGDINCDSSIDAADAVGILSRFVLNRGDACLSPDSGAYEDGYDVNCDGVVGPGDGLAVLLHLAGADGQGGGDCPAIGSQIE